MISDTTSGQRVSNLDDSHPEIGNPITWLIGITNSKVPSSASLMSSVVLMVGIREAQLAKQSPERKKNVLMAMRCLVFTSTILIMTTFKIAANVAYF